VIVQDRQCRFEALVGPHFEALYRAAYRLTRRRPDAEDLVQEVCLRAFAEVQTLETLDYVRGWLLRVQYRVFVDNVRRQARAPFNTNIESAEAARGLVSDLPGPDELTDAAAQTRQIESAWHGLTADQRALLGLHAEGYGLAELEQILGTSRNALAARLHRARRQLAKRLNGALPPGEHSFLEKAE
jgi:RNA polymerase sigma factor (sigma-70 family)